LVLGELHCKNRMLVAPCTRNRANVPGAAQAKYYSLRASAGLIVGEATTPVAQGYEFSNAPGLYDEDQVAGWKLTTDAVHAKGGIILAQLMNIGRVAHPVLQSGRANYSASAIAARGGNFRQLQKTAWVSPTLDQGLTLVDDHGVYVRPVEIKDPKVHVEEFRAAAEKAKRAGFDGVEIIKEHVESWKDLSPKKLHVERLAGLSNKIFKVSVDDKNVYPRQVIYREFGEGAAICDRKRENYIIKSLAQKEIAPIFYGADEQHRVEKFLKADELTKSDFKEKVNRRKLAKLMAKLHNMNLEKLDKTPLFLKILQEKSLINEFKEKAAREDVYTPVEKKFLDEINKLVTKQEIEFLKKIGPKDEKAVVFSHNDLHAGNVLKMPGSENLLLIDFEYSDYNYRGYDLANLFNETMFEYDVATHPHYAFYPENFPKDQELLEFIKYYLFFKKVKPGDVDDDIVFNDDKYRDAYISKNHDIDQFNKDAEELLGETKICRVFSHYFWCLWAVIQSHNADMDFDYMHYAYKRYELYQECRKLFADKDPSKGSEETSAP